jgi:phosphohistidine phosphatase SixA/8-oxo-dGTP pyrophosphatase MutT (NUDIX family)
VPPAESAGAKIAGLARFADSCRSFTCMRHTDPMSDATPVRAAGVVVLRPGAEGPEVLVIHRNLRADWSLPKGKVEPGEHPLVTAVRECDEESGVVPILGVPLERQEYVALGEPKIVDYWAATVGADEGFAPDEEVDEVHWLPPHEAAERMTYPRDGDLVRQAVAGLPTTPLILLRHTQAMKRADFKGKIDTERPLSGKGRSQAKALMPMLAAYGIEAVHSSDAQRCRETVKRYAKSIDATISAEQSLSEEGHAERPKRAARRMRELLADPRPIVVCSHRPVLPTLVEAIAELPGAEDYTVDAKLPPGGFWVIHRHFTPETAEVRVVAVERHTVTPE